MKQIFFHAFITFALILGLQGCIDQSASVPESLKQQGTIINQNMIADLQKQGAIVETLTNYTKVEDKNNLTIYFFTLPNHPAHPFYFKARIVENNGSVEAITTGEGYGDKVETDKWLVEINQIVKRLQQHYKVNKNR